MKRCPACEETKPLDGFAKNSRRKDGLQVNCRACQQRMQNDWYKRNRRKQLDANDAWRSTSEKHKAARSLRVFVIRNPPKWADRAAMHCLYTEAARRRSAGEDCQVDHIVPIVSELVCGLHVHNNLQLVTCSENSAKGNRTWPDMP